MKVLQATRRARWAASCALGVPVLVLCSPFLFSSRALYGGDYEAEVAPRMEVARRGFLDEGELPRWNPFQFAGTPILGNGHGSYSYPPSWVCFLLPPQDAIEWLVFAHLLLGAGGMYRLARQFRVSRTAGVLAGLSYALGFGAISRIDAGHLYYTITHGQAPWLLYALLKTLRFPSLGTSGALALWTGAVIVGGAPQWVYLLGVLSGAICAWQLGPRALRGEAWLGSAAAAAGGAILGALLSSVELFPALEVASHSIRNSRLSEHAVYDEWYATSVADLISLVMPHFPWTADAEAWMKYRGWHEKCCHVGILPLAAALAAPFGKRKSPAMFFGVAAILALAAGMALILPVNDFLRAVLPWYSNFRLPSRTIWVACLSLPLLAAFGWDAIARGEISSAGRRILATVAAPAALGTVLVLATGFRAGAEALLLSGLAAGAGFLFWSASRRPATGAVAVLVLACELCALGMSRLKSAPGGYVDPPWYLAQIGGSRADYRLVDLTRIDQKPSAYGFRLLKGYSHPILLSVADMYGMAWQGPRKIIYESLTDGPEFVEVDVFRNLNVRWIASWGPPLHPSWKEIARHQQIRLYEDPEAKPAAFLERGTGEVTVRRPGLNSIEITVRTKESDSLILSEAWMPGWRAWVGGELRPVAQTMVALMKVDVPSGESRVRFVYEPLGWRIGKVLSLCAAGVLGVFLGFTILQRKKPDGPTPVRVGG